MSARRILSLWLPSLAMDHFRLLHGEEEPGRPRVLIADSPRGPRIEAVGAAAADTGACVGMTLADARALCPAIASEPYSRDSDLALLEQLAVWALRWGPWAALDPPDGLLVDITAVSHLFGGESALLADAEAAFRRRGLAVRAASAPTAGAAWGLAHYGPRRAILDPSAAGDAVPAMLCDLPVAALRLDGAVITVLRRLGIRRIAQLAGVEGGANGRDALQRRFRNRRDPCANPLVRLDQLLGRVAEPLLPVVPSQPPLAQRRLMEPIRHRPLLDRVIADLSEEMGRELERRGEGARRLELGLWRVDGAVSIRQIEFAAATRDAAHICRMVSGRLEDIDAGFGIELVRLRADWSEPLSSTQDNLASVSTSSARTGTSLATCIDRLTVRLGDKAVTRPVPFASHLPERAQRWRPPLASQASLTKSRQGELDLHYRPLKLLDKAEQIAVLYATPDGYPRRFRWRGTLHEVARVEGPERIAPEWWREQAGTRLRDYYRIEDQAGRRYWIYRAGTIEDGRGGLPDWFMHGLGA